MTSIKLGPSAAGPTQVVRGAHRGEKSSVPKRRTFLQILAGATVASLVSRRVTAETPAATVASAPKSDMTGMDMPSGATSAAPMNGMPMGAAAPLPKGAPPAGSALYKKFALELKVVQREIAPGVVVHMMAYNGQVPGPTIRVNEGDWVWVDFTNASDEMHTIHWHGMIVDYRHDGVPYLTQDPVMRGEKYAYVFQAKPYGTHFYHCHFGTLMHMQAGMYGAIIVESADDPIRKRYPYTEDYVLILSSIDTVFVRTQMNSMFARMKQRDALGKRLDLPTQNRHSSLAALVKAIKGGYVPPYARARAAPPDPRPDYFLINGRAYPATEPIMVKEGEWTRIRYVNVGNVQFNMHLHGHDFFHVCTDGAPLPNAVRMNTLPIAPGRSEDIVFLADNPGFWALHDHDVTHTSNNGVYPGGAMTDVEYRGLKGGYQPTVSLDE